MKLRADGVAYPNDFRPDSLSADLHNAYDEQDKEALAQIGKQVKVAGRMMLKRVMGKASRSEEHTSELQSLMRISYAVFCLKKKKYINQVTTPSVRFQNTSTYIHQIT